MSYGEAIPPVRRPRPGEKPALAAREGVRTLTLGPTRPGVKVLTRPFQRPPRRRQQRPRVQVGAGRGLGMRKGGRVALPCLGSLGQTTPGFKHRTIASGNNVRERGREGERDKGREGGRKGGRLMCGRGRPSIYFKTTPIYFKTTPMNGLLWTGRARQQRSRETRAARTHIYSLHRSLAAR